MTYGPNDAIASFGPMLLLRVVCSCSGPWNGLGVEVGGLDGLGMLVVEREGGWGREVAVFIVSGGGGGR